MFRQIGQVVSRRPWTVLVLWIAAAAVLIALNRRLADRQAGEPTSFLPDGSEQQRALRLMAEAFPALAAQSQAAVVACRPGGLQPGDMRYLESLAGAIRQYAAAHRQQWTVLAPGSEYLRRRLVSTDGEAALLVVNLPTFYANTAAAESINIIEDLSRRDRPAGLMVELSGTAAAARDYGNVTRRGVHRTAWVTILCVLVILLLVYRSPVAAALPIVGIGICTTMALLTLDLLAVLADRLSPADQDFLLAAAGDRSRGVVARAIELLTRLPDSALRRDMRRQAVRRRALGAVRRGVGARPGRDGARHPAP